MPSLSNRTSVAVFAVCLAALAVAVVFTHGMTPSFDSVRYANVAHWISEGEGISTSLTVVPVQDGLPALGDGLYPFTIQPPGLPLFYAATGVGHLEVSHRILNILAFVSLVWLTLALGRELTGRPEVGIAAAVLTLLSPLMLLTASHFWTDLPTASFLLGALYLVIVSRRKEDRAWIWLLGASALAAVAVGLRLTSLAFGFVILADAVLNRRLPWRTQLARFSAGAGLFGVTALVVLGRNTLIAGRYSGIPAQDWPIAAEYSLARGWAYLGSRILQALTPGWAADGAAQKLAEVNGTPQPWPIPGILLLVLGATAVVCVLRHRKKHSEWSLPGDVPVSGAHALVAALILGSLAVLLLPATRNPNFHVVEWRFVITLLPFLWIGIMAVVMVSRRTAIDVGLVTLLALVFAVGVPGRFHPYQRDHDFMSEGLGFLDQRVPVETPVFTNGGKVLLDQDLARRVYHISDWNFRHVLGSDLMSEEGLLQYLRERGIDYVALFGKPNMNQARFWGRPIMGLFLEMLWKPWLIYTDEHLKVYRIPATGTPEREAG